MQGYDGCKIKIIAQNQGRKLKSINDNNIKLIDFGDISGE